MSNQTIEQFKVLLELIEEWLDRLDSKADSTALDHNINMLHNVSLLIQT